MLMKLISLLFFSYLIILCLPFFYLIVGGFRYAFLNLNIFVMYSFYSWSWILVYANSTSFYVVIMHLIWYKFFCSSLRIIILSGWKLCFRKWQHSYFMTRWVYTFVIIIFIFIMSIYEELVLLLTAPYALRLLINLYTLHATINISIFWSIFLL